MHNCYMSCHQKKGTVYSFATYTRQTLQAHIQQLFISDGVREESERQLVFIDECM